MIYWRNACVTTSRSRPLNNPYHAPAADLAQFQANVARYEPAVFAIAGRLGRLRFISYSFWLATAVFFGISISITMLAGELLVRNSRLVGWTMIVSGLCIGTLYGIRRLRDMGFSAWWAILCMLPPISILVWFALACVPGQDEHNRFGPPAANNGWPAITGACLGITAMVAIVLMTVGPAYNTYMQYYLASKALQGGR